MKFRSILASLVVALAGFGLMPAAHADDNLGLLGPGVTLFGNSFGRMLNSFTDYYTFEIDEASTVVGGALAIDFSFLGIDRNVDITSVTLSGDSFLSTLSSLTPDLSVFSFENLTAGAYQLAISGSVPGRNGGSYEGALVAIASPAPEPEVYAMAALGLLGVGFAARRRQPR